MMRENREWRGKKETHVSIRLQKSTLQLSKKFACAMLIPNAQPCEQPRAYIECISSLSAFLSDWHRMKVHCALYSGLLQMILSV